MTHQNDVVEQLQSEVNKFIDRTATGQVNASRVRCMNSVRLDSDGYLRVSIELKYWAGDCGDAALKHPIDLNSVEEGT